jgi:DNA-binding MarR family transcriptional regulator
LRASSPPVDELAADLHSAAIRLLRRVRREDDASGLTAARLSALSVLVFSDRMTLGELARAERVSLPTMTRIAAALVKAGYAKRAVEAPDRRYVYLEATRAGIVLLDKGQRRRVDRLSGLLARLDTRERAACARALAALAKLFEDAEPDARIDERGRRGNALPE